VTFDNDGTFWVEESMPLQFDLVFRQDESSLSGDEVFMHHWHAGLRPL
jgi:hypothetical protein